MMKALGIKVALTAVMFAAVTARAQETKAEDRVPTREEAMYRTAERIRAQLREYGGGSWETWAERLTDYRSDIRGYVENWKVYKWPWPTKDNYVFQGAAIQVLLDDDLNKKPTGRNAYEGLVHLNRQLKALGIDLIVAFIPSKLSIYPEYLYAAVTNEPRRLARAPEHREVSLATRRLQLQLLEADVEVVDLHTLFREYRREHGESEPLFYQRDSHWVSRGCRVAAAEVARRLKRYDFVQKALPNNPYKHREIRRNDGQKADPSIWQIIDSRRGRPYGNSAGSPILLASDSYGMMNQHLKAEYAGQIALHIGMPLGFTGPTGGGFGLRLAKMGGNLRRLRVVILSCTERTLMMGKGDNWPLVDLPIAKEAVAGMEKAEAAAAAVKAGTPAVGTIESLSPPPDPKSVYPHYVMAFHVKDLKDADGKALPAPEAVVHVLAMHSRKILPVASLEKGKELRVNLTPWSEVQDTYARVHGGSLSDPTAEITNPHFWGVVDGAPVLDPKDITGEEDGGGSGAVQGDE
jgi:hypothetical protein